MLSGIEPPIKGLFDRESKKTTIQELTQKLSQKAISSQGKNK